MSHGPPATDRLDGPLDGLGRPLGDLRISVTDRCNFRCTYCMPAEIFGERYEFLPRSEILSFEEFERLTRIFVAQGVQKVRITGGEPLLRADLPNLVARLSKIDGITDLALTTNASLLSRQAKRLRDAGLQRVTVSLDSIDEAVFAAMTGGKLSLARVLEGIDAAQAAGLGPIKLNCVVQRGVNDHTLVALARHFKGSGYIVRFIEFMDVGTRNRWDLDHVLPAREIVERIDAEMPLEPAAENYRGEVARRWRYRDGEGEIGVIASVTQPFCGDCTRARLSTEGKLVTCLFAAGGIDLRAPLRAGASDSELSERVRGVWRGRRDRYSEERSELLDQQPTKDAPARDRIEMYQIGG
jgi:cyclic pyranopterin phosphate synthase